MANKEKQGVGVLMQIASGYQQVAQLVESAGYGDQIDTKPALKPFADAVEQIVMDHLSEVEISWQSPSHKKRGWDNEHNKLVFAYGNIRISVRVQILRDRALEMKVRIKMNELYALKIYPKEKVTFLDAGTCELVTRPQGLQTGMTVLRRLLPQISDSEAKRLLTDGGLIKGLDFRTAWNVQFELDKFEAQYVKSAIQLTVSVAEALVAVNRAAEGDICCNNDWGKGFIANPFEVARRIFEAPDVVKAKPCASPHSWWKARRGDEEITLWHYHGGTKEVEFDVDGKHGMTWVRYDYELSFLVRQAIEEAIQSTES